MDKEQFLDMDLSNIHAIIHADNTVALEDIKNTFHKCIDCIFNEISDALANGEDVHIAGFGNFSVSHQDERVGWDFEKNEHVAIQARKVVSFQCSDNLKKILNGEPIE